VILPNSDKHDLVQPAEIQTFLAFRLLQRPGIRLSAIDLGIVQRPTDLSSACVHDR